MNATERSIVEQFPFWDGAPEPAIRADASKSYVVVGCGTSYYLAQCIAATMNLRGIQALAVPGSEWTHRAQAYVRDEKAVTVVALSRSGESTETVQAAERSRSVGIEVIGITCDRDSSLTRHSDHVIFAETHPQEGIVMTSSASLMVLMALRFIGVPVGPDVTREADRVMRELDAAIVPLLSGRSHFVYLGSGPLYGVAQEGSLKLQEMSLSYTQAYHPMEYRHGPISLVEARTLVVMLYSPEMLPEETKLVAELRAKGAAVIGLGGPGDLSISLDAEEILRGLICLPALQILGERLAVSRKIDSTAPRHLTKVVLVA
ncbi:glucosamine--fructose-6-phosphate aminotransferase (isomerizing) [Faunimonas pinastri]|uniref:Glucosamine--fructose-6-phosphate aminotransferase (Isomerizing) n=1 Tax=Faunimonas pinastri TaxID=1855383 RepID=A0A1H9IG03_9HYPH|nr:SIS domain-containing protein [Faunimonas pinastri]SEQ73530.1 glucosamine--fructose-6-phosphate aminotransferase (isomerizing) [Faunimonas pinastri]